MIATIASIDEVGAMLESIDPGAHYWIAEDHADPEHIERLMNRELRLIAGRGALCFGREHHTHGRLGFFEPVPWYYRYLRANGYPAALAHWIANQEYVEVECSTVRLDDVTVRIAAATSTEADNVARRRLRRRGMSTEAIDAIVGPTRNVSVHYQNRVAVMLIPVTEPYLMNAYLWRLVAAVRAP